MKSGIATSFLLLVCASQALFAQTPDVGIRRSGTPPAPPVISSQAQIDAARLETVPADVRPIRARQLAFARELGVDLTFSDRGRVSVTRMRGVPAFISDATITNEAQVIALAEMLYPLFGFSETERLVYSGKVGDTHRFQEEINGLPAESMTVNIAMEPDHKIYIIRGTAVMDRNFASEHFLDAQGAMEAVDRHLGVDRPSRPDSQQEASLVYRHWDDYRTLAPWWLVDSAWYVDPDGGVSSAVVVTP